MKFSAAVKFFAWCSLVVTGVSGTKLLRPAVNSKSDDGQEDRRMLFRTSALHHKKTAASVVNNAASTSNLRYYGGPVISNVDVQPLFWTTSTNSVADSTGIVNFYKVIVNSTHMDWLSQYNTPTQTIGRGIGRDAITLDITSLPQGTFNNIDDVNHIQPYLKSLYTSGVLNPTANSYYPIHFAPGIRVSQGGSSSCSYFCAYHGTINVGTSNSPKYIYYGVIPDQYSSGCQFGCGRDSNPFNNLCSVSSHELIEAVTDPAVGVAPVVGPPLAWYDPKNGEIADICNAQQGVMTDSDGVTWTVQKEWSNSDGACVVVSQTSSPQTPKPAPTRKPTKPPTPKPTKPAPTRKPTKPAPTTKPA